MSTRDDAAPVVDAHRLLQLAAALSEGATRMQARLRHLDPELRDEVLDLVTTQVSEIVGLWAELVREVVPTAAGDAAGPRAFGVPPTNAAVSDHELDDLPERAAFDDEGGDEEPSWRAEGSAAHERWETAYGPDGARRDAARHEIERMTRDELTGVLNRQAGLAALGREVDRCRRADERLVLGFLNVDRLGALNEARGARVGDELLRKVAAALRATLRSYDVVVRLGGDEFLFSLPGADMATAEQRFNEFSVLLGEEAPGATASVGFAKLRDSDTLEDLISRADVALVKNRRSRRRAR
ncbi:MAG TPA: GGDEF domain-containing protein [Acidimicrobiales bacterium]|nr:GGDEF domain-containing protein [Acidimicrobiales bacterium]